MAPERLSDSSLLLVLFETNAALWEAPLPPGGLEASGCRGLGFAAVAKAALALASAHLLADAGNALAFYAVAADGCHPLYLSPGLGESETKGGCGPPATAVAHALTALASTPVPPRPSPLAGSLSRLLCLAAKVGARTGAPRPRLLCLTGSPDAPEQYVPMMNAIFAAQAAGVPVDTCALGGSDSAYGQQAAALTGGLYLRPPRPAALLQYLLAVFLPAGPGRAALRLPPTKGVDFRAACFCHKRTVDTGYVCSVCLSIFCAPCLDCSTCGTEFPNVRAVEG